MNELCSVIMPAYNSEQYIAAAIESVLKQTYRNIEMIIVDDCSSDNTAAIICEYAKKDKRIKFLQNNKNLGCAESRNRAVAMCGGEYVAFIDSDDIWKSEKLSLELEALSKLGCDAAYTAYEMIDNDGSLIKKRLVPNTATINALLKENFICFSSVLVKADIAKSHLMSSDFFHEDYCYLLSLLNDGAKFTGLNKTLVQYRLSRQNRSKNKLKAAKYRWLIYRKYLNLGLLKSYKCFACYFINGLKKYYGQSEAL
jgi:teichuronic acid biosynthesis glycosyltransferase TuaG